MTRSLLTFLFQLSSLVLVELNQTCRGGLYICTICSHTSQKQCMHPISMILTLLPEPGNFGYSCCSQNLIALSPIITLKDEKNTNKLNMQHRKVNISAEKDMHTMYLIPIGLNTNLVIGLNILGQTHQTIWSVVQTTLVHSIALEEVYHCRF